MKKASDTPALAASRRLPVGAEPLPGGGTHFRVWAPGADHAVVVELEPGEAPRAGNGTGTREPSPATALEPEGDGYCSGTVAEAGPGTRYRFRVGERALADPASRHQPAGPFGPSAVVDPDAFAWSDGAWAGVADRPVVYELHVGTFTPEGTWAAAAERLPRLRALGVTVVELMPLADFPGRFGWGYDGVFLFAPHHGYGQPDDLRRFVDTAHRAGVSVILDVVYNHLGPDGNVLGAYSPDYFSRKHTTEWGDALNFDGPGSEPVRALVLANVRHWIEEYHVDGFRFDATQSIHDDGPDHVLAALAREARAAAGGRRILLLAENEPQDTTLVRSPSVGGYGFDAMGNDDFHHSAVVALTGRREGYYSNHRGTAQELVSALLHGFLYQGQWYRWQNGRRGSSTRGLPPGAMVHYLENHDQVANRPRGARLHAATSPGRWRAMVAVQLLGPQTPLLFQGQEFASSAPFLFFADHRPEIGDATRRGREAFLEQFRDLASPEGRAALPDPTDPETFRRCKLDWKEWDAHEEAVALHRDLLRLRAEDPAFSGEAGCTLEGAVLGERSFVIRWSAPEGREEHDRLLLVNLGPYFELSPAPEPLLAPPPSRTWRLLWSSEHPRYGGPGTPPVETRSWNLPADSAVVLEPAPPGTPDPVEEEVRRKRGPEAAEEGP